MILVQFFFPYFYFSSLPSNSDSFEVGITYVYEQDELGQIYDEVSRIKDLGFQVKIELITKEELLDADEVFLLHNLRESAFLIPVYRIS